MGWRAVSQPLPSSPQPGSDVFSEAARAGLTALNATALVVCTTVSASLSLYADLAGQAAQFTGYVALAGWLLSIGLALYLAGKSSASARSRSVTGAVAQGLRMARARPGFASIVLLLSLGATFTVWSRARADHGGLLTSIGWNAKRAAVAAESASATADAIKEDTQAIRDAVVRPASPVELLARQGFSLAPHDVCRAITQGNLQAARLFKEAGVTVAKVSVALGGGQSAFCLESTFLSGGKDGAIGAALDALPIDSDDLQRLYVIQTFGVGNEGVLQPLALLPKVDVKTAGRTRLSSVRATPLMLAVWGGDVALVDALLTQGANADQGGRYDFGVGSQMLTISVSPLAEALRLGRFEVAQRLKAAGGRSTTARIPYFT